jgi:hypothetical protein
MDRANARARRQLVTLIACGVIFFGLLITAAVLL